MIVWCGCLHQYMYVPDTYSKDCALHALASQCIQSYRAGFLFLAFVARSATRPIDDAFAESEFMKRAMRRRPLSHFVH